MAQMAVDCIDGMEGTLKQLAIGLATAVHLRSVSAHVQNALYHAEQTPEITRAAGRLLGLAHEFGQRHGGVIVGPRARDLRAQHLANMQEAYLGLRTLLKDAKPSAESVCLGG